MMDYNGRMTNRESTEKPNSYQFLYIYSIPPDDGLQWPDGQQTVK